MKFIIIILFIVLTFLSLVFYYVGIFELFHSKEPSEQSLAIKDLAIEVKELKIAYLDLGDIDLPTVLFLHGWAGKYNQDSIRQIITAFNKAGYRAIAMEQPGMGRSQTPNEPWTNEQYADFVKTFLDELEIEKVILVGQSFGGGVAARFAAKYPERLNYLVLVNSASTDKSDFQKSMVRIWGDFFPKVVMSKFIPDQWQTEAAKFMLRLPDKVLLTENKDSRVRVMGQTFILTHSEDLLDQLKIIETPTLIVLGKSDRKIPRNKAWQMKTLMPNARLFELDGGHTVIYFRPKATVDIITANL